MSKKITENSDHKEALPVKKSVLGNDKKQAEKIKKPVTVGSHPGTGKKETKKVNKIKSSTLITIVAIVIAVLSVALSSYNFWLSGNNQQEQNRINQKISVEQSDFKNEINKLQQQLKHTTDSLKKETQARKQAQQEHLALDVKMENISAKLGRSGVVWRMAEVEYLLTVGAHRLNLMADAKTAIVIFETADQRIKAIGDSRLLTVRQKISDELTLLRAIPVVDVTGLSLKLGSLATLLEALPLSDKKRIAMVMEKTDKLVTTDWQTLPLLVWQDIKNLVQVRRHEKASEPLLAPEQRWYLYQNLQLKLEQARLALLRNDTVLFHQHIRAASGWVKNYFEVKSAAVVNALETLDAMLKIELKIKRPDISTSLRLLRNVMRQHHAKIPLNKQAVPAS
jgi:uroporphyrin-III C-methyltransferase